MKFLLDQDVYASTARFLMELGHNVVPAAEIGLSRGKPCTVRVNVAMLKYWPQLDAGYSKQ